MKKAISLIWYIIYSLLCIAGAVYFYFGAQVTEDWEAFGAALLCAIFIIAVIPGIIAFICKLIHIRTEWKFFGFICTLIDFIGFFILDSLIWDDIVLGEFSIATLFVIVLNVFVVISLIANVSSLRD